MGGNVRNTPEAFRFHLRFPIILTDIFVSIMKNSLIYAAPLSDSKKPPLPEVHCALCFVGPISNSVQKRCRGSISMAFTEEDTEGSVDFSDAPEQ